MNQEEAITFLHQTIKQICHESGLETTGLALSINRSVVFVYVTHRWQNRILSELLPEVLGDYTVIVKYRGNSGRAAVVSFETEESP